MNNISLILCNPNVGIDFNQKTITHWLALSIKIIEMCASILHRHTDTHAHVYITQLSINWCSYSHRLYRPSLKYRQKANARIICKVRRNIPSGTTHMQNARKCFFLLFISYTFLVNGKIPCSIHLTFPIETHHL